MNIVHWFDRFFIVIIMVLFVAIVAVTYWPGRKAKIEQQGQIPFQDDL